MLPSDEKVKLVGAVALHPVEPAEGPVALSVIRKPVTPMLSVAENPETGTVKEADVAGSAKLFMIGNIVSGTILFTETVTKEDCVEFPALS